MSVYRKLEEQVGKVPADLTLVAIAALLAVGVVLYVQSTPVRTLFGLLFVLFVPGYALVSALFPKSSVPLLSGDTDGPTEGLGLETVVEAPDLFEPSPRISGLERGALSLGTSIVIAPLVGLGLSVSPWRLRAVPIVLALVAITLLATVVAYVRRRRVSPENRYRAPFGAWARRLRASFLAPERKVSRAVNLLLVFSVVLAVASLGFAVAVPNEGERFTGFYLFTENEQGELVASGYPTEFSPGESQPLYVSIHNQEHRPVNYTVVVELQRIGTPNDPAEVTEERRLDRFNAYVEANETRNVRHEVAPEMTGEGLRLVYLVYRDDVPADPTTENAYRELHIWIDVSDAASPARIR